MNDNPAKKIVNFSKLYKKIFTEINNARTHPAVYANKLEKIEEECLNKNKFAISASNFSMPIVEGQQAFNSAIKFLNKQQPLEALIWQDGLYESADELLTFLMLHDGMETSSSGTKYSLDKRVNKHGVALGELDEIIDYGMFDAEMLVLSIILSDSDPQRRERDILFNPILAHVGISSNILPSERVCTVINFVEKFFGPNDYISEKLLDKYTGQNSFKNTKETVQKESKFESDSSNNTKIPFRRMNSNDLYEEKKKRFYKNKEQTTKQVQFVEENVKQNIKVVEGGYEYEDDDPSDLSENVEKIIVSESIQKDNAGNKILLVKKKIYYYDKSVKTILKKKH